MGEIVVPKENSYPIAVVGAGKLGSAIEKEARKQGRNLVDVIDNDPEKGSSNWENNNLSNTDTALIVTTPTAGYSATKEVLERGVNAVVGTTKFYENEDGSLNAETLTELGDIAKQNDARFLFAPNFTFDITEWNNSLWERAPIYASNGLTPIILEAHHIKKLSDLSGSAKRLIAPPILSAYGMDSDQIWGSIDEAIWAAQHGEEYDNVRYARDLLRAPIDSSVEGAPADMVRDQVNEACSEGKLPIIAVRYGDIPGSHAVWFINEDDNTGELLSSKGETHHVWDRSYFAKSALGTADWLRNQEPGGYNIKQRYGME